MQPGIGVVYKSQFLPSGTENTPVSQKAAWWRGSLEGQNFIFGGKRYLFPLERLCSFPKVTIKGKSEG